MSEIMLVPPFLQWHLWHYTMLPFLKAWPADGMEYWFQPVFHLHINYTLDCLSSHHYIKHHSTQTKQF
jgi:hypothetical protein